VAPGAVGGRATPSLLLPRFFPVFSPFLLFPQLHPLSGRSFLALPIVPTISSFLLIFAWFGIFSIFSLLSRLSHVAFLIALSNIREDKEKMLIFLSASDITVGPLIAKMYIIIAFASRRRLLFVCWRQPGIFSLFASRVCRFAVIKMEWKMGKTHSKMVGWGMGGFFFDFFGSSHSFCCKGARMVGRKKVL
jgi:hypothetical protein